MLLVQLIPSNRLWWLFIFIALQGGNPNTHFHGNVYFTFAKPMKREYTVQEHTFNDHEQVFPKFFSFTSEWSV